MKEVVRWTCILLLLCLSTNAALAFFDASLAPAHVKYRPNSTVPTENAITIHAMRGEWVSFQVVTRSDEHIGSVDVVMGTPDWLGINLSKHYTYRQLMQNIIMPSRADGEPGEWPDALVPRVDKYYGEARNAYPYDQRLVSRAYNVWGFDTTGNWEINRRNRAQKPPVIFGAYADAHWRHYLVRVTATGNQHTARVVWSDDGGATWSPEIGVPHGGVPAALSHGLSIMFPPQPLYALDDTWEFFAGPVRNEFSWIEVFIPEDAYPGMYTTNVTVTAAGFPNEVLAVTIVVHNVTIPVTSTIPVWYGAHRNRIAPGHARDAAHSPDDFPELLADYQEEGLYHRISLMNLAPQLRWNGEEVEGWHDGGYGDFLRPYMNGGWGYPARLTALQLPRIWQRDNYYQIAYRDTIKALGLSEYILELSAGGFQRGEQLTFSGGATARNLVDGTRVDSVVGEIGAGEQVTGALSGATATVLDVEKGETFILRNLVSLLGLESWTDRVYNWLVEEPRWTDEYLGQPPPDWMTEAVTSTAATLRRISPAITQVATEVFTPAWQGAIDRWASSIRVCDVHALTCPHPAEDVPWSYAACGTHHCGRTGDASFLKYPTHVIDTGLEQLMGLYWLKFSHDISGDLYWETMDAYPRAGDGTPIDPWDSLYGYGGNGDGTLFYPGRPDTIGGTTHIPISSLRIKAIREGLEQHDLLRLAALRLDEPDVKNRVRAIVGMDESVYTVMPDGNLMAQLIEDLIIEIEASPAPACGDGIRNSFVEECDDGNDQYNDGCTPWCLAERCGDGQVQGSEACDDGNYIEEDGCLSDCSLAPLIHGWCGNAVLNLGEECDDGNEIEGDGCYECRLERLSEFTCGNFILNPGEQCDDGNRISGDGCSKYCFREFSACDDGTCDARDVCPGLDVTCPTSVCYEPVCDHGCRLTPTASGQTHEQCQGDFHCDGVGRCVPRDCPFQPGDINCDRYVGFTDLVWAFLKDPQRMREVRELWGTVY